jgi:hypothetical protein
LSYTKNLPFVFLVTLLRSFPIWQYVKVADRVEGFVVDVGTVVGHVKKERNSISSRTSHTLYLFSPIIEYQGASGEAKKFTSTVSQYPATPLGTKIKILVESINRNIAYEAGPFGVWLGLTISACISLGFALFIAFFIYLRASSNEKSNALIRPNVERLLWNYTCH